jgi:hypothetical protein
MIATYWNSLDEAMSRRVAHVVLGLAVIVTIIFNWVIHIIHSPGGVMVSIGPRFPLPPAMAVPAALESVITATGALWFMFVVFAAAPLLTAGLEKGWLDLTFSKGTPRWKIFLGRFFAGVTLYAVAFALATFPLAARLWWATRIGTWEILVVLLIQTFSFAAIFSVCALAALPQRGVALPIIGAIGLLLFSTPLVHRKEIYGTLISSQTARDVIDWIYRILPKYSELGDLSRSLIKSGTLAWSTWWWPVWSTGAFMIAVLGLTLWLLHRKSF